MYKYKVCPNEFIMDSFLKFINMNKYELITVTRSGDEYTVFYKDNKEIWGR